jgi:hypothetical protein
VTKEERLLKAEDEKRRIETLKHLLNPKKTKQDDDKHPLPNY